MYLIGGILFFFARIIIKVIKVPVTTCHLTTGNRGKN